MGEQIHDVAIIGAGPAGASAATLLAKKDYDVVLVDRHAFPRSVPCGGWLNARARPILKELNLKYRALDECAFREVTLYNADCSKSAKPDFSGPVGFLVDRAAFDTAMAENAVAHGAGLLHGTAATDIRLNESTVTISLAGGQCVTSKLLLVATGRGSELVARLGFDSRPSERPIWSAQVEAPLPGSAGTIGAPRVSVILGVDGGGSFGFCCVSKDRVSINVNWFGPPEMAVPTLVRLCKVAAERGVIPLDLSKPAEGARLIRSPAAAALDMETHVGKHTLLIGDAGGFVSAASNEGIYPAMWSAKIAVQAIDAALQSPYSQDQLMQFDSLWRMQIADHLRSPHTDIRFLLPLIFSNQPMADRMGAAFFFGENI